MHLFKYCPTIIFFIALIFNILSANDSLISIYELLRDGSIDELRSECLKRGISDEGNELQLKRRLLEDEKDKKIVPFDTKKKSIENEDILLNHSDFIEYEEGENGEELIRLRGNVNIIYGDKQIFADEVKINSKGGIITGNGNVIFIDGSKKYFARRFFYSTDNDEGLFFNAKSSIEKFIYSGKTIRKLKEYDKFVASDVSISTCNLKNPHYHVRANELYYYDDSKLLLIKDAAFYYGSDNLFNLPYYYKNLEEPAIKSSLYFRERSGLVVQNTYYHLKTDTKELLLKGDFYERLGEYIGADYKSKYTQGETKINLSSALSKNIYYYDNITENWSPLGPQGSDVYRIERELRYDIETYQKLTFGSSLKNTTELYLYWAKDPYYEYDFQRRLERFDLFKLIEQAEYDYPRKSRGFTWYLNSSSRFNNYSIAVSNTLRFEPQRNIDEDVIYLPDYYEYRVYSATIPCITFSHSESILNNFGIGVISGLDYNSYANYSHIYYFDENEKLSSELHKTNAFSSVSKAYTITDYIQYTPAIELGASYQQHVNAISTSLLDDKKGTMFYSDTTNNFLFGGYIFNVLLSHRLKYKILGPEDNYDYWRFKIHNLNIKQVLKYNNFTQRLETGYDLKPFYNWEKQRYENFAFDESHFSPLINSISYLLISGLELNDRIVYSIQDSRLKTNDFILNYQSNNIYLSNFIRNFSINWNISWKHNFIDPFLDTLSSKFGASLDLSKYLTFYFSVYSKNDSLWKYFKESAEKEYIEKINPFIDLLKSFNFFNIEDRKDSNFKMKSIAFGFIHDLHDWELKFDYTGKRVLSYDVSRYVWDNTFSISIGLKEVKDLNIHTRFNEKR